MREGGKGRSKNDGKEGQLRNSDEERGNRKERREVMIEDGGQGTESQNQRRKDYTEE